MAMQKFSESTQSLSTDASTTRPRKIWGHWRTVATAALTFGLGLAVAAALPSDTTELGAANATLQSTRHTVEKLEDRLAVAEDQRDELSTSLASAERREKAAQEQAQTALAAAKDRKTRLDERERSLQQREAALISAEESGDTAPEPASDASSTTDTTDTTEFNREYAVDVAYDIIEDISSVDERLHDGIMVTSALSLLSDSYARLVDAGIPPGIDESTYYGRVTTLQSFAAQAADTYGNNPTEGTARYAVIRRETGVLFESLNTALDTDLMLP